MLFGGVKAWLYNQFTAPAVNEIKTLVPVLLDAQAAASKVLLDAQAANAKALVDYMNTNFATKQELQQSIEKTEEETDAQIQEKLNSAPRQQYFSNKEARELKDEAIINKALSMGVPMAMTQMLLGRLKSELRHEYNAMTAEAINDMSKEQIEQFISRVTGKPGQQEQQAPNCKMYG